MQTFDFATEDAVRRLEESFAAYFPECKLPKAFLNNPVQGVFVYSVDMSSYTSEQIAYVKGFIAGRNSKTF